MKQLLLILLLFGFSNDLLAYPEMVRHGYVNCTTCHVSPNGGGVLTPYGRQLSREVLSTWGSESEALFLYGAVKPPEWLLLGGDVRAMQMYVNSPNAEIAKFIFMQADAEAAASVDKFQLVATLGRQDGKSVNQSGGAIFSRRHYLMYKPTDEWSFRVGRFEKAYGLNVAEHTVSTRRGLGWDEGGESYNLEGAWIRENTDVFATASIGRPDDSSLQREKAFALRASVAVRENSKVGLGYIYGTNDVANRHVFGPYAVVGFTKHFFLLAEFDFQKRSPSTGASTWGFVDYLRLDYEFVQGVHGYLSQELTRLDWNSQKSTLETYGLGAQFFPRPHLEIQGVIQKQRNLLISSEFSDVLWIQGHLYL